MIGTIVTTQYSTMTRKVDTSKNYLKVSSGEVYYLPVFDPESKQALEEVVSKEMKTQVHVSNERAPTHQQVQTNNMKSQAKGGLSAVGDMFTNLAKGMQGASKGEGSLQNPNFAPQNQGMEKGKVFREMGGAQYASPAKAYPQATSNAGHAAPGPKAKLQELKQMLDDGLIDQADYDKKKAEILASM